MSGSRSSLVTALLACLVHAADDDVSSESAVDNPYMHFTSNPFGDNDAYDT